MDPRDGILSVPQNVQITVDLGATHIIVRGDLQPIRRVSETPGNHVITTVGGEAMGVPARVNPA